LSSLLSIFSFLGSECISLTVLVLAPFTNSYFITSLPILPSPPVTRMLSYIIVKGTFLTHYLLSDHGT
jgi:hypothetical protein